MVWGTHLESVLSYSFLCLEYNSSVQVLVMKYTEISWIFIQMIHCIQYSFDSQNILL